MLIGSSSNNVLLVSYRYWLEPHIAKSNLRADHDERCRLHHRYQTVSRIQHSTFTMDHPLVQQVTSFVTTLWSNVTKSIEPPHEYQQDGPEALEISQHLPYFPFKGIPRFYDIGGFLYEPAVFQKIVDIFANRYRHMEIDVIAGLDARGFILGPPIGLALQKPFIMMRKKGKMPNSISSDDYITEYGKRSGLTVQRDKIQEGMNVLIIDDLVATGGTLGSAISLVKMLGGKVVECACVVELKMFIDPPAESNLPSRTKLFKELGHEDVPVWGLISEDLLVTQAELHPEYVDDGEEH